MTTIDTMTMLNIDTTLLERAKKLAPAISERTVQVEEQRHVHDDSIDELKDAGFFKYLLPKRWGGEEGSSADFMAAVIEIGKACTSTAWVACILTAHNWEMAHMTEQLQAELFEDDPNTLISSSYAQQGNWAKRVPGGFQVSGRWKSSSGIPHCQWVALGVNVEGEAAHNIVVPLTDATVVDDWHVLGMQGTGSRSVVLEDVFVPEHRAIDREILLAHAAPGLVKNTAPLFKVSQSTIYSSVAAAPAIGAGWRFYEEFPNYYGLSTSFAGRSIADDARTLNKYAECRGMLQGQQHLFLYRHQQAYQSAMTNQPLDDLTTAEAMFDLAKSARTSLEVAMTLMPLLRPSAVYHTSIMQRLYRDIVVARQHGTQNADTAAQVAGLIQQGRPGMNNFILPTETLDAARERAADLGYLS